MTNVDFNKDFMGQQISHSKFETGFPLPFFTQNLFPQTSPSPFSPQSPPKQPLSLFQELPGRGEGFKALWCEGEGPKGKSIVLFSKQCFAEWDKETLTQN